MTDSRIVPKQSPEPARAVIRTPEQSRDAGIKLGLWTLQEWQNPKSDLHKLHWLVLLSQAERKQPPPQPSVEGDPRGLMIPINYDPQTGNRVESEPPPECYPAVQTLDRIATILRNDPKWKGKGRDIPLRRDVGWVAWFNVLKTKKIESMMQESEPWIRAEGIARNMWTAEEFDSPNDNSLHKSKKGYQIYQYIYFEHQWNPLAVDLAEPGALVHIASLGSGIFTQKPSHTVVQTLLK
jgi:hypothetical protein